MVIVADHDIPRTPGDIHHLRNNKGWLNGIAITFALLSRFGGRRERGRWVLMNLLVSLGRWSSMSLVVL